MTGVALAASVKGLQAYPNPVDDGCTVLFNADGEGELAVEMVSLMGEVVLSESVKVSNGQNSIYVNRKGIPAGCYLLRIGNDRVKLLLR
ncbi:MAG: T9SS type A sorting domain-containing protein [Paludibacteraceae bacterium]|nr:T9SS type A sorting domain-containing protein [Paludibacteraceae bacterium]